MHTPTQREISLNFMPAFFVRHVGVRYGEAYYFDPAYRAQVERAEAMFLHDILGAYGVGSPTPRPSPNLFIQPIDLLKLTQGAALFCPTDATLESRGTPWADLAPAAIDRLDVRAATEHPIIMRVLAQYREMTRLYEDAADLFGLKAGRLNLHTPFTTAHQLCGERLFLLLRDDPTGAALIFAKVWQLYQAVTQRLCQAIGAPPPGRVQLGDCSASLVSAAVYRSVILPSNTAIARAFATVGYHSCGPSSHLLNDIRHLPPLASLEVGPGTDLDRVTQLFPASHLCPLVNPVALRGETPAGVAAHISAILQATAPARHVTLCAWSCDRDTPVANVRAVYDTVRQDRWTAVGLPL